MKLAAAFPVSDRAVPAEKEDIGYWVNKEAIPLSKQVRTAINTLGREKISAVTSGTGAYVRIWESDATFLPSNACWTILARVSGISISGAAQRAGYGLAATFQSTSGAVAQVGTDSFLWANESVAAIDVRFGVDAPNRVVFIEARDDAVSPMRFTATVETLEGLTA